MVIINNNDYSNIQKLSNYEELGGNRRIFSVFIEDYQGDTWKKY